MEGNNSIIPLDFEHTFELPETHTWTQPLPVITKERVPVIDLNHPNVLSLIREACENYGAFQIINHGMPISLLNQVEYEVRKLFSLPMQQKLLTLRSPEAITGYGMVPIAKHFSKLMWSEGFSMIGSPVDHAIKLWPNDHSIFCNVMVTYQNMVFSVSEKITELMIKSLGLNFEDIGWVRPQDGSPSGAQSFLQLNSYPICPDPERAMGLTPHTDSSLVTLLYQGDVSGLQINLENVGWLPVDPVYGALVVNAGDLMHIVSNGRFKSPLHRAMVNKTSHRISVAYFYGPPEGMEISPCSDDRPMYGAVTWEDYRALKSKHNDKALELIRLDL